MRFVGKTVVSAFKENNAQGYILYSRFITDSYVFFGITACWRIPKAGSVDILVDQQSIPVLHNPYIIIIFSFFLYYY